MSDALLLVEGDGPIVATAIHDGHGLRDECARGIQLDDAARLREEDPYTGEIAAVVPTHLVATRSRFEVDLNRPRDQAVYLCAADAWQLDVWATPPSAEMVARSLAQYDAFYAVLERVLRDRQARHGRFVVLDIHSYNHRRAGAAAAPAPARTHPEINVGTGSLDRARWAGLVERFCTDLAATAPSGRPLDVRENVKFKGGELSRWVHRTFPDTGCCLAVELKKTFMDEWTGRVDDAHLARLARAIASTLPGLLASLRT